MDGYVTIETELDTKDFDAQIKQLEYKLNDLESDIATTDLAPNSNDYLTLQAEIEKTSNKLLDLRKKQANVNAELSQSSGIDNLKERLVDAKENIEGIGKGTEKIIKKIARWSIAIFGIRSAYMFVRNAINKIAGDDEQLKADIDYMKTALAYTIEPVVRGIIDLAKQLMTYLGYIVYQWTGKNIFENANKSLNKAGKSAKDLQKTLAGFDEMNVVSDNGGGGGASPSFKFENIGDTQVPEWVDFIVQHKDEIVGALLGIAGGILAIKLGAEGLTALGLGLIISGIYLLIQDIQTLLNDPSWEAFGEVLRDIGLVIVGLGIILGSVPLLIIGIITLITGLVIEHWEEIKGILEPIGQWIYDNVIKPVWEFIKAVFNTIVTIFKNTFSVISAIMTTLWNILKAPFVNVYELVKNVFNSIKQIIEGVFKVIKGLFTGDFKQVMEGFKQIFKGVFNSIWSIVKAPLNLIIEGINALIKGANKIKFDIPDWVPVIGGNRWGFNISTIPRLAKGGIVNLPSKGVPIGGAIAGERGQEGVIPLTDSQQMQLLGEAIGKYITINANIVNTMNGRVIGRELQKINGEQDFAYNR